MGVNLLGDILKDFAPVRRVDSILIRGSYNHDSRFRRDENELAIGADPHVAVIALPLRNAPPEVLVVAAIVLPSRECLPGAMVTRNPW